MHYNHHIYLLFFTSNACCGSKPCLASCHKCALWHGEVISTVTKTNTYTVAVNLYTTLRHTVITISEQISHGVSLTDNCHRCKKQQAQRSYWLFQQSFSHIFKRPSLTSFALLCCYECRYCAKTQNTSFHWNTFSVAIHKKWTCLFQFHTGPTDTLTLFE